MLELGVGINQFVSVTHNIQYGRYNVSDQISFKLLGKWISIEEFLFVLYHMLLHLILFIKFTRKILNLMNFIESKINEVDEL